MKYHQLKEDILTFTLIWKNIRGLVFGFEKLHCCHYFPSGPRIANNLRLCDLISLCTSCSITRRCIAWWFVSFGFLQLQLPKAYRHIQIYRCPCPGRTANQSKWVHPNFLGMPVYSRCLDTYKLLSWLPTKAAGLSCPGIDSETFHKHFRLTLCSYFYIVTSVKLSNRFFIGYLPVQSIFWVQTAKYTCMLKYCFQKI